jgi:hypothetical protein
VKGRRLTVRAIALLGAGSAAVHQLRYAIAYGDGAPHQLAAHGHGYLDVALPGVAIATILVLAAGLMRVARARPVIAGSSLLGLWLACAVALAAIYGLQETLEGAGAVAGGGWIGLALALPAGLLVALALRGSDAAELRVPGVSLRLHVVRVHPGAERILAAPTRLPVVRLSARAPPLGSFV